MKILKRFRPPWIGGPKPSPDHESEKEETLLEKSPWKKGKREKMDG